MDREFLGRGWRFPVGTDSKGQIEHAEGEADIRESIRVILGTARGERIMRPDFGCGIHDHVFATVDTTTLSLIEGSVEEALVRWEPRIEVQDVDVSTEDLDVGKLLVHVEYRVRNSNNEFNLVYPFYIEEA